MKYIRKKDRIFDITEKIIKDTYYGLKQNEIYIGGDYKQADTIEKLCDFVDIQFDDGTWETYSYENEFKIKLLFKKAKQVFYGIRTDKGLIYVAKMNEKGELELL